MIAGLIPRRVLLIGMMGSGKSTIGRALAARTGWPFLDNDALLERRTGRTARSLRDAGVEALRDSESQALHEGLTVAPPAIIGVAAGIVLRDADIAALRGGGTVVWLRAAPVTLARRILADPSAHRPWLDSGADAALAWLTSATGDRSPLYRSVADIEVETDNADCTDRPPNDIVDDIAASLAAP